MRSKVSATQETLSLFREADSDVDPPLQAKAPTSAEPLGHQRAGSRNRGGGGRRVGHPKLALVPLRSLRSGCNVIPRPTVDTKGDSALLNPVAMRKCLILGSRRKQEAPPRREKQRIRAETRLEA